MGLEVFKPIIDSLGNIGSSGISAWLAWTGLIIIAIIGGAYLVYGVIKLSKIIVSLKIKDFALLLLIIGVVLIGIAIVLP